MRSTTNTDSTTGASTAVATVPDVTSKVPQVTAVFWVLKLLTTAMGEAASDFLVGNLGPLAVALGGIAFALSLWLQFRLHRYHPFAYWGAVMMVAVFGTMAADVLHHELHVPVEVSTLLYGLAVAVTFVVWHRTEGTLSMHSISTRRREVFYWLAVTFTFALGTAAGDVTASRFHFGFAGSIVFFAVLIAMPAVGFRWFRLGGVAAFWWAYILTRPLGASIADWLGKPHHAGGLGYGDGLVAAALLAVSIAVLSQLVIRKAAADSALVPAQA